MATKIKRDPSDLTGVGWAAMEGLLPKSAQYERRRKADLREVLNALRYLLRSGCGWRMLPKDFPAGQTVCGS